VEGAMTDWKLIGLMAYVIASIAIGTLLLSFSMEFFGDGWEIHDYRVRWWPNVIIGLGLLLSAWLIAHGLAQ
jgi:hypothetical protein